MNTYDIDVSRLSLDELIDRSTLQSLLDDFYELTCISMAIIDIKGDVLVACGWQDICTKFHRKHPETARFCIESDTYLAENLMPGEYVAYKCKNNLWDVVTPLYVENRHVGNLYTGQFFYDDEAVDESFFVAQADKYGFDKEQYLEALRKVPRFSRKKIKTTMSYIVKLTAYISQLVHSNLMLKKAVKRQEQAKEDLGRQFAFLQRLIDTIPYPIFFKDKNGIYQGDNDAFDKLLGLKKNEIKGKMVYDISPPKYASVYYQKDKELFDNPGVQTYETIIKDCEGVDHNVILNKATYHDSDGNVDGLIGIIIDVTQRKQAEDKLRQSEEKYRTLFDAADSLLKIINKSPAVVFLWKAQENWPVESVSENVSQFGYTSEDFTSGKVVYSNIIYPDDLERIGKEIVYNTDNGIDEFEQNYRILGKSGEEYWINDFTRIRRDENGKVTHYQGIILDVTQQNLPSLKRKNFLPS